MALNRRRDSGGKKPTTPTIGTATAGNAEATVAFTASTYSGKATVTYRATSNPGGISSPGGITATAASSPITVTGLTNRNILHVYGQSRNLLWR